MNKWNKLRKQNLGEIPQEASSNLQAPETAPSRSNKVNIRTKPLNFKVSEEFYWQLKDLALKEKSLMVELLEKSLECYKRHCSVVDSGQSSDKELEKYVKAIETKPQKVFTHPNKNFDCDKCGKEFQNKAAYSYDTSLEKTTRTYCRGCINS